MRRSCPLVPGSLIPFYPLLQPMSHSYREVGVEGREGKRRHDKREERMGFTGVEGFEGVME